MFTTLGTVLPWSLWAHAMWPVTLGRLFAFGALVILFRRLPIVFLLQRFVPEIRSPKEAGFVGWFGPMGVGAIYYALKCCKSVHESADSAAQMFPDNAFLKQQLFAIISFVVLISTIVHGMCTPTMTG